ncbi:MAG: tetratricopeptide repeat protein [Vicinamibacteria bacterium]
MLIFIGAAVALGYNYYQLHHETTEAEIKQIEALIVAGKGEEARPLMMSAQTRSKNVDALRLRIGRAYLHEGNVGPATALLRQVGGSLSTEESVAVAEYFLVSGDPFSATKFYDAALKSGLPRTAANLGRYGEAQSLAGNGDLAVGAFREALVLDPSRSRVRLNLAVTLANLGRYADSRAEVAALLKTEPTNEKALKLSAALQNAR